MSDCRNELFQAVRIVDVIVLGPLMIRAGRKFGGTAGAFLTVAGLATILLNGVTFFDIENQKNGIA